MKIYVKKMRNKEDLEREKRLLIKERKRIEDEGFFSFSDLIGGSAGIGKKESTGNLSEILSPDLISMAGPVIGMLSGVLGRAFAGSKDRGETTGTQKAMKNIVNRGGSLLGATAKELIGGYLKWKAIELSYKGIKLIVKRQKRKKAERIAEAAARGES